MKTTISSLFLASLACPPPSILFSAPCYQLPSLPVSQISAVTSCSSSSLASYMGFSLQYTGRVGQTKALVGGPMKYGYFRIQPNVTASASFRLNPEKKFDTAYYRTQINCSARPFRSIIARSDLVQSGIPDSTYSVSEVHFSAKARGLCFYAVTAIAATFLFVLMIVGHPFVLILDPYKRKFHHLIAKIWARLSIMPFFKVDILGLENLPGPDVPAVYVSNHQSFLDIYTLLTLGRSFKFISKTSVFLYPVVGWAMFLMGVIPLKRLDSRSQLECLKRCMDLIEGGASVSFFPEGTRSKDGKLGAFKKGAFSVAAKTGVPVVPITLHGTGSIMPAGKENLLNPGSVKVVIHRPLESNDAVELCDEARNVIARTLNCEG